MVDWIWITTGLPFGYTMGLPVWLYWWTLICASSNRHHQSPTLSCSCSLTRASDEFQEDPKLSENCLTGGLFKRFCQPHWFLFFVCLYVLVQSMIVIGLFPVKLCDFFVCACILVALSRANLLTPSPSQFVRHTTGLHLFIGEEVRWSYMLWYDCDCRRQLIMQFVCPPIEQIWLLQHNVGFGFKHLRYCGVVLCWCVMLVCLCFSVMSHSIRNWFPNHPFLSPQIWDWTNQFRILLLFFNNLFGKQWAIREWRCSLPNSILIRDWL